MDRKVVSDREGGCFERKEGMEMLFRGMIWTHGREDTRRSACWKRKDGCGWTSWKRRSWNRGWNVGCLSKSFRSRKPMDVVLATPEDGRGSSKWQIRMRCFARGRFVCWWSRSESMDGKRGRKKERNRRKEHEHVHVVAFERTKERIGKPR
eukprot:scaffold957_cov322-Pavlova_lutheri.AAC.10